MPLSSRVFWARYSAVMTKPIVNRPTDSVATVTWIDNQYDCSDGMSLLASV